MIAVGRRPTARGRASWRVRHAPVLVLVLAIVATACASVWVGAQTTVPDTGLAVEVTPTGNLVDGQLVTTNISASQDVTVLSVQIRQCRLGATYATEVDLRPEAGNCPSLPLSTNSYIVVSRSASDGIIQRARAEGGFNLGFKIGVGAASWSELTGNFSLTCDPDHPCAMVVQVRLTTGFVYKVVPLDFAFADVIAACNGPAAGVLSTAAPDRLSDAWAGWTRSMCKDRDTGGAPGRAAFSGEDTVLRDFDSGAQDLVYTSVAYNPSVGLGPDGGPTRSAFGVPLALNATVLAVGGGYKPPPGEKVPYPTIKLTAAEVAAILGGGNDWFTRDDQPYKLAILGRNEALGTDLYNLSVSDPRPAVPSTGESVSWMMTSYLTARSPADWIAPGSPSVPRGLFNSFVEAVPPFPHLNTYTGRPSLEKATNASFLTFNSGPLWVLTDLATAKALSLTPVAIENANGAFVAPTEQSMRAAVSTLRPDANGALIPDPNAVGATPEADAQPYPLTFVEYGLAPAEPLVDEETCTARTASQKLLTDWLGYITGDGQENLPAGLVALPSALNDQAAATIAVIGTFPVTGPCAGLVGAPSGGSAGPARGAGNTGSAIPGTGLGSSTLATSMPGLSGLTSATSPTSSTATSSDDTTKLAAVPAFAGRSLPDSTGGIVALLGIVLITSLAAWLTAGGQARIVAPAGAGATGSPIVRQGARPPTAGLVLLWFGVVATGVGLVVYQLGPMLQQQDQHDLLAGYKQTVRHAANEGSGLPGVAEVTKAPELGDPVGVLEIGALQTQLVTVEGVSSSQTEKGPGHAPGTAGLGQPGNSVVVARRNGYGGEFADLSKLRRGDKVLATTTQGQSVYKVTKVRAVEITDEQASTEATATDLAGESTATKTKSPVTMTLDELYGPTEDDRLTLVTSASKAFWNTSEAVVVSAKLVGTPFEPTPQGARSADQTGRDGETNAWASVVLVMVLYVGAITASIMLYRRMQFRVAYILTVAPIVALTVLAGVTLSRLLPGWT